MHEWKKRIALSARADVVKPSGWNSVVRHVSHGGATFFSCFEPARSGIAMVELFARYAADISAWLDQRGALLFRGFELHGVEELDSMCHWIGAGIGEAVEETSPRTRIVGKVYTATDYPSQYEIAFHNESSYESSMPSKLLFCCMQPSTTGGATRLTDCRAVWRALPVPSRQRFAREGYRLTRTYHPHFGLSWQRAFGVDDPAAVEAVARRDGIELDWTHDGVLTTKRIRPCVGVHPRTGETVWTNHLYFFHHSNLPESAREALQGEECFGDHLVNDTHHANGDGITRDVLAAIEHCYEANAISIEWKAGDVLLVDNLSVAHGRRVYEGARELYVVQFDSVAWTQLQGVTTLQGERR